MKKIILIILLLGIAACSAISEPVNEYPFEYTLADTKLAFKTDAHRRQFIAWAKETGYPCDRLTVFKAKEE